MTATETRAEATETPAAREKQYKAMAAETDAMRITFDALNGLENGAKQRVLEWLSRAVWEIPREQARPGEPPRYDDDEPPF